QDRVIGFLNLNCRQLGFYSTTHAEHLMAFAAQAATAIQNAQLYKTAQHAAVLADRQRLSRELHDAVSQLLFSSSMIADALPRTLPSEVASPKLLQNLDRLKRLNRGALAEM